MSAERYGAYSVLMSVYSKENPAWLKLAIESIQGQTLPTSDFVLVCDGPLTPELDGVIAEKHCQMGEILMVVRLEKNVGLGNALNEGIKHCRNELVARMDSDDIAYPDRCEKQVAIFNKYPIVSICSGTVNYCGAVPLFGRCLQSSWSNFLRIDSLLFYMEIENHCH